MEALFRLESAATMPVEGAGPEMVPNALEAHETQLELRCKPGEQYDLVRCLLASKGMHAKAD
jgi:hypothetical protein